MSIWDDPDLRTSSDYVSFEKIGDRVAGTIINIRAHKFDDGKVVPQLLLDVDGEEKTVTAGQVRLKAELAEKRPNPGDAIVIELTDIEKRAGGKTLKHFKVDIGAQAMASAPAALASGQPLTPEQVEAMKLLGIDPAKA
jgi:hypothetical protein